MSYTKKIEKVVGASFHLEDELLNAITFKELVITLQSNEKVINEAAVQKVFKEILDFQVAYAKEALKDNMANILKAAR